MKYNSKLYLLYNEPEASINIKIRKLQSAGFHGRMDDWRTSSPPLKDMVEWKLQPEKSRNR